MPATAMRPPTDEVLDLFAVPGPAEPLPGGSGGSWRAGDLALSPGRGATTQDWLSPMLARLAVGLDERPGRRRRDLRLAMPVPARNGSWVVHGWGASRFEPGTTVCRELPVITAAGRLLHAELAAAVTRRPAGLDRRTDAWFRAERVAFGGDAAELLPELGQGARDLLVGVRQLLRPATGSDPEQLVHGDLAGNVLLDPHGAPLVIDFAPYWRSARWAEAVVVLDAVVRFGAPASALGDWGHGPEREAMLRAILFRALSDGDAVTGAYERVLHTLIA